MWDNWRWVLERWSLLWNCRTRVRTSHLHFIIFFALLHLSLASIPGRGLVETFHMKRGEMRWKNIISPRISICGESRWTIFVFRDHRILPRITAFISKIYRQTSTRDRNKWPMEQWNKKLLTCRWAARTLVRQFHLKFHRSNTPLLLAQIWTVF